MSVQISKRLLTVSEYHKMAEAGILTEDDRVELIHGEIIEMSPIGSLHTSHVKRINKFLNKFLGDQAIVSVQDPVAINDYSEPEPDIAILRYRDDFYKENHPSPTDIFMIIEVADTSLDYDRDTKLKLYANAGIPEFWIVNLEDEQIEVYKTPTRDAYLSEEKISRNGQIFLEMFELKIQAKAILG
jgi:Uma2 family endonuclease